ncbi:MAG TPA: helix-turn-helix domain-containing protein [Candidatus Acidoferrum sp.]|nr:helix-turn-helix domain-containing protein [Candidatus Acidoferrum sp.]
MAILTEADANRGERNSESGPTRRVIHCRQAYSAPRLLWVGQALDVILARAECKSRQVAERVRRLIDESSGSLSFSPAGECQKLQVSLSLVSRQFKKIYQVTIRSYARNIRMKTAEKLLKESKGLNIDEMARIFGYSFTSAFSRCFQQTFGKRPKRFQMQHGSGLEWSTTEENGMKPSSQLQASPQVTESPSSKCAASR